MPDFKDDDNPTLTEWLAAGETGCAAWYDRHYPSGPVLDHMLGPNFCLAFATEDEEKRWWQEHPLADEMECVTRTICVVIQPKI